MAAGSLYPGHLETWPDRNFSAYCWDLEEDDQESRYGRRSRGKKFVGSLGVRGLSLADKVVDTTNPSSATVVREGDQNVSAGWHPGQGVYHLSTRTLRNSQLQGLENQRLVVPAFAAVSSPRLSSSEAPSTVTPSSFLFNLFSPFTPPPCVWPPLFISAPGPSSLLPPRSPGRFAFPGSRSGLSGSSGRRRHLPAGLPASRNRPAKCGRRGARKRRGGIQEPPGSRLSSGGRRCQLRAEPASQD